MRTEEKRLTDFRFATFTRHVFEWWRGKHGSERVKLLLGFVNCAGLAQEEEETENEYNKQLQSFPWKKHFAEIVQSVL